MYSLILDSSTKILYVCLLNNDKVVYERYIEGRNDHAKNIVSAIDQGLKEQGITTDNLSKIVCGYGPGSYTGVRMAVTVCKMMSVFKSIPLYIISTLKLMASGAKGICKAMIDARRGNAFSCVIDVTNNKVVLDEGMHSYEFLNEYSCDYEVKDDSFKVDPLYCLNNSVLVSEPHLLVPNYLRDTEAERNL